MNKNLFKHITKTYEGEKGYMEMLSDIMKYGDDIGSINDRTSVGHRKLMNRQLVFDIGNDFPASTSRLVSPRLGFEEFWAFLNGRTDIHPYLSDKNIHFWKGNTTREFLDNRGLTELPEGYLGKAYSCQYRNFGGNLNEDFQPDMTSGFDQLKNIINELQTKPYGRRMLVSIWNPKDEPEMALPPCFWAHQFVMLNIGGKDYLNLKVFSRSCDVLFGTNQQTFAIYIKAISKLLNVNPGLLTIDMTDAHIYFNQFDYVNELLTREVIDPYIPEISKDLHSFEDLIGLKWEDIDVDLSSVNREKFVTPHPEMAV